MKALTIRQPWATLIALGVKRYETRSRPTNVRGRVAIHAGLAMPTRKGTTLQLRPEITIVHFWRDGLWLELGREPNTNLRRLPVGAVVATARLVDCIPTYANGVPQLERELGDWTPGRWAWQLDDVQPLAEPIPAKGRQGWWEWDGTP